MLRARSSFPAFIVAGLACIGCAGSSAAAGAESTSSSSANANAEMHVEVHPETHLTVSPEIAVDVEIHIEGRVATGGGAGGGSTGEGVAIVEGLEGEGCPGLSIHGAGETRRGRALGASILQVYARPDAELLVDGQLRGQTPLVAVGVDAGPRDLRLRNMALGYDCTVRLRALPGERYSVLLDLG